MSHSAAGISLFFLFLQQKWVWRARERKYFMGMVWSRNRTWNDPQSKLIPNKFQNILESIQNSENKEKYLHYWTIFATK